MLNPQLLVNCHGDALLGSQFETILLVQTSQAGTQEKKYFWLCPGIETSLSERAYWSTPSFRGSSSHPHTFPTTITNCSGSCKQQRQKGVLGQLPCLWEKCKTVKVVLKKPRDTGLRVRWHANTQGYTKQGEGEALQLCACRYKPPGSNKLQLLATETSSWPARTRVGANLVLNLLVIAAGRSLIT